jgi:hypothetical protein
MLQVTSIVVFEIYLLFKASEIANGNFIYLESLEALTCFAEQHNPSPL